MVRLTSWCGVQYWKVGDGIILNGSAMPINGEIGMTGNRCEPVQRIASGDSNLARAYKATSTLRYI